MKFAILITCIIFSNISSLLADEYKISPFGITLGELLSDEINCKYPADYKKAFEKNIEYKKGNVHKLIDKYRDETEKYQSASLKEQLLMNIHEHSGNYRNCLDNITPLILSDKYINYSVRIYDHDFDLNFPVTEYVEKKVQSVGASSKPYLFYEDDGEREWIVQYHKNLSNFLIKKYDLKRTFRGHEYCNDKKYFKEENQSKTIKNYCEKYQEYENMPRADFDTIAGVEFERDRYIFHFKNLADYKEKIISRDECYDFISKSMTKDVGSDNYSIAEMTEMKQQLYCDVRTDLENDKLGIILYFMPTTEGIVFSINYRLKDSIVEKKSSYLNMLSYYDRRIEELKEKSNIDENAL